MTKKARTDGRRKRGSTAAGRQRRGAPRRAGTLGFEGKVDEVRRLARPDVPLDLIRDYVKIGIALDEELAGRRDAPAIRELASARVVLAERLGIVPREHGLGGELRGSIAEALTRAKGNTRRFLREKKKSLQEEIRQSGYRDGAKEIYARALARLRGKKPGRSSPAHPSESPGRKNDP